MLRVLDFKNAIVLGSSARQPQQEPLDWDDLKTPITLDLPYRRHLPTYR